MSKWKRSTLKTKSGMNGMSSDQQKLHVIDAFQEKKKIKEEISNFFSETSFTALTRIYKAQSIFRKVAWTVVVLSMMTWLGIQCYWLLDRYFGYPMEVKLDLKAAPELDFPSVTVCNLNPILEDHLKDEPFKKLEQYSKPETNDTLFTETLNTWMFNESCDASQYLCSNGRCIPTNYVCDGWYDCNNGDDESDCDSHVCNPDQFKCSDNRCLLLLYRCNNFTNCADDEVNCTGLATCPTGYTACTTGGQCIFTSWVCDGMDDCQDGSDEPDSCPSSSNSTETTSQSPSTGRKRREAVGEPSRILHRYQRETPVHSKEQYIPQADNLHSASSGTERFQAELARRTKHRNHPQMVEQLQESFAKYIEERRNNGKGFETTRHRTRRSPSAKKEENEDKSNVNIDWETILSNSSFNKWDALANRGMDFYAERDDEWEAAMTYGYLTAKLNNTFVESSGHLIKNMIASCEFNGYQCSPSNFTFFHNHKYGNCYTFNSQFSGDPKLTTQFQGPAYGLKMELFLNQDQYVANLATEAGIKVLIHQRGTMPFPEDQGITIMPGRSTSVGIKQVRFSRLTPPHGVCANKPDAFVTDYYMENLNVSYSKLACLKSCYQRQFMYDCFCAVPFYYVPPHTEVCDMLDKRTERCVNSLIRDQPGRFSACDYFCPQPCEEIEYDLSISSSQWPSNKYETFLAKKLSQTNSIYRKSDIDDDFTKIQIYFQDLIYRHIEQQKAYESMNLISDLGGQLGLWLGLSAITIGELCSFLFSVGRSLPTTYLGKAKTTPLKTKVTPMSTIEPATLEDMYDDLCPDQAKYEPPDIINTNSKFDGTRDSDI